MVEKNKNNIKAFEEESEIIDTETESIDEEVEETMVTSNKAPTWIMRVAGGLIDFCLIVLAIFGLNQIFNSTGMGKASDNLRTQMILIQDSYKLDTLVEGSDETYGHKVYENEEDYGCRSGCFRYGFSCRMLQG